MRLILQGLIRSVAVLVAARSAPAEEKLWLVRDGRACATIVYGSNDNFAAEQLQRFLADKSGVNVDMAPADRWRPSDKSDTSCVVVIGSDQSNPVLHTLALHLGLRLDPAELWTIRSRHDTRKLSKLFFRPAQLWEISR